MVGTRGLYSPCRLIPKDFKNGIHSFPPWRSDLEDIVESQPATSLVSLNKVLDGTSHLYVKDMSPRHFGNGNSQASANVPSKIQRYNSLSREWRVNMDNTIQKNTMLSQKHQCDKIT